MNKDILASSRPAVSVKDFTQQEIVDFLRGKLTDHQLDKAFIFGSVAEQCAGSWSDIDVIIIKPTTLPFVERGFEFLDLFDLGIPVDILVYTPEEFLALEQDSTPFWRQVKNSLVRIC